MDAPRTTDKSVLVPAVPVTDTMRQAIRSLVNVTRARCACAAGKEIAALEHACLPGWQPEPLARELAEQV